MRRTGRIFVIGIVLAAMALLCFDVFFAEINTVYCYEISAVYEYQGTLDAIDIKKNSDFSSEGNVLIVAVKENELVICAQTVYLDKNFPVGTTEIKLNNLPVKDGQRFFAAIWNSISDLKPLTSGDIPQIIKDEVRVEGNKEDWVLSSNGKRIYEYKGNATQVQIPNYIDGKHITTVAPASTAENMISIFGDRAEEITALEIPEGIQNIGPTAFFGCKNIESQLYLPKSLIYIGFGAFYDCGKMTGNLIIPQGIEAIPPYAFWGCNSLGGELTFLGDTGYIGDYSFVNCTGLTGELILPQTVTYIGGYAFGACYGLTGDLVLPDGVTAVGDCAFAYCEGLKGSLSLGKVEYIGDGAFARCGFTGELCLPDSLTYIGYGAFEYCQGLTGELLLPPDLLHIGDAAFNHCTGFTNEILTIPASVQVLGGDRKVAENTSYSSHLFYDFGNNDFAAIEVEWENEHFCAQDGVLYDINMERLIAYPRGKRDEVFEIPEGIIQIDELAFSRCRYLKELVLPDSYVIINEIPPNVVNQNGNSLALALYNHTGVKKITAKESNPNYISENGILYSRDGKTLWYCPTGLEGAVVIPHGVERIEKGAFYGANGAVSYTSVYIPETVSFIDEDTLNMLNEILLAKAEIDKNNRYYKIIDGKIEAVE